MLEPPITTANTVLCLMAVDYPANKVACYVSDDGCSPLTLYSLTEASKFARFWIPFCKKYNIQVRAPMLYFSGYSASSPPSNISSEIFQAEERKMKEEYEKLKEKIEDAVQGKIPIDLSGDYAVFANTEKNNHPAIVKVIWENKERISNGLPHLIYVSREKRPNHQHHYKAGAMNVLTRVSGVMTNAPFTLNVDSDMFINNPKIIQQAMWKLSYEEMKRRFGNSTKLIKLATQTLSVESDTKVDQPEDLSSCIEMACQVASCDYELETAWGSEVGWMYGSITEDLVMGMKIHSQGWSSVLYLPDPPAFIGSAPPGGPIVTIQKKRWATGQLEVLFSRNNPILLAVKAKLKLRQCLAYIFILMWCVSALPELLYSLLPVYSIVTNSHFLPKVGEVASVLVVALVLIQNIQTFTFSMGHGQSLRKCWNTIRMNRITNVTGNLFAYLTWILKLFGISEAVFEVTKKYHPTISDREGAYAGRFSFDDSAMYVPITALLFLHMTVLAMPFLGLRPLNDVVGHGPGLFEYGVSAYMVLSYWPYVRGLFGKGKYGIPFSTKCKAALSVLIFLLLCRLLG
ncbi:hypothetical protein FEM48_Zijuj04G0093500 [Ziziphus jujuba var. spinosa]|uniref:Cellulose synthase-like protein H1 n=1 Tax=Ziziphus jujuba var. spinosa TaxID=714518 RepID=A0A978VJ22_ZIZJJ|nr:hypothetical protein FEM48_Zijuj04G0093500 [Ziziphus jujuba var. spinosa]